MNPHRLNVLDALGVSSAVATVSLQSVSTVAAAVVTVAALLPLAIVRWRNLLSGKNPDDKNS